MKQPIFQRIETNIAGCFELCPHIHHDERGQLVKIFQQEAFEAEGLCTNFTEDFYSVSLENVIRGLHFQTPPKAHVKLVYCINGLIQDVVVDLRTGSPTFGKHTIVHLSAEKGNVLYIPAGLAHGFCTLSQAATVVYKTSSSYSPAHDSGILWNSADIPWATSNPVLSARDLSHPPLSTFSSPFVFDQTN
ncbi:dTDP-4-dehydrorhamnose 3,5-epimerase [Azonexus sp.]|uniref:dTDP-4-dehydrorhamnose 3,5-epimerase n=1 Tax=Azonexus sp. TaxID=1872668 RepID=UPI0027B8EB8F|nr:dTDP-4-dehydrorhamnose 3,5-epimerase [Azonexus sp.]